MFQSQIRLHDENTNARIGQTTSNKDLPLSTKKTAFSDVKNLLGTNTPSAPTKPQVSGLKKPVFGSKFQANNVSKATPVEGSGKTHLRQRNYKPRIDLSSIDYSDNEPHTVCKSASGGHDILRDFWSVGKQFEIYQEEDPAPLPELMEMPTIPSVECKAQELPVNPPRPNLFDDFPDLDASLVSFDDL